MLTRARDTRVNGFLVAPTERKSDRAENVPGPGTFLRGPLMKKSGPLVKKSGPHFSQNNLFCCSAHPHRLTRYSPSTPKPPPSTPRCNQKVTHARDTRARKHAHVPGKSVKITPTSPFLEKKPKKMIRLIKFLINFPTEKGRIVCGPI